MTQIGLQLGNLSQVVEMIRQLFPNRFVLNSLEIVLKLEGMICLQENYICNCNNQISDLNITFIYLDISYILFSYFYESKSLRIKDFQIVTYFNCGVIHAL